MILGLVTVFILQVVTTAMNTLRTIFITKGISKPAYILTFIDAILFSWGMKLVVTGEGYLFLIIFAVGKTVGTLLGDIAEKRLALGTLEVTIYAKREKAIKLADQLRDLGYSVNTRKAHGLGGTPRFEVCLIIQRKEYKILKDTLQRLGFSNATMSVRDVNKVTGKIQTSRNLEG